MLFTRIIFFFFFLNDTATTEIYTLSLHDALPISYLDFRSTSTAAATISSTGLVRAVKEGTGVLLVSSHGIEAATAVTVDRKSTRLNSSHLVISYAVFCLKKKKKI